MRVAGSPLNEPRFIQLDQRDWDSMRDRLLHLEEDNRRLNTQMLLLMQGVKERLDVFSVLLARLESTVAGKDVE
jgi:hypothetical protein